MWIETLLLALLGFALVFAVAVAFLSFLHIVLGELA
jgi:hypothetical protein